MKVDKNGHDEEVLELKLDKSRDVELYCAKDFINVKIYRRCTINNKVQNMIINSVSNV